jgi:hypothetical protein
MHTYMYVHSHAQTHANALTHTHTHTHTHLSGTRPWCVGPFNLTHIACLQQTLPPAGDMVIQRHQPTTTGICPSLVKQRHQLTTTGICPSLVIQRHQLTATGICPSLVIQRHQLTIMGTYPSLVMLPWKAEALASLAHHHHRTLAPVDTQRFSAQIRTPTAICP